MRDWPLYAEGFYLLLYLRRILGRCAQPLRRHSVQHHNLSGAWGISSRFRWRDRSEQHRTGQIVGVFAGTGGRSTGYVRNPDASFATFSGPGGFDTYAEGINDLGEVILHTSSSGPPHNFLRGADGSTYMPINSAYPGDLFLHGLNNTGQIVGTLQTPGTPVNNIPTPGPVLGYLLNSDGSASVFQYPGASDTFATGINNLGVIAGRYTIDVESHGFIRNPDGSFVSFDVPELLSGLDINDLGEIVGSARNQTYVRHADGSIDFLSVPWGIRWNANAIPG